MGAQQPKVSSLVYAGSGALTSRKRRDADDSSGFVGDLSGSQGTLVTDIQRRLHVDEHPTPSGSAPATWGAGTLISKTWRYGEQYGRQLASDCLPASTSTVTVTNPETAWNNSQAVETNIDSFGTGTLTIANSGMLINNTAPSSPISAKVQALEFW